MKRMTLEEVKAAVIDAIAVSAICGRAEVELSWTAEEWLGELKRRGKIQHFRQEKGWEEGNKRKYIISY